MEKKVAKKDNSIYKASLGLLILLKRNRLIKLFIQTRHSSLPGTVANVIKREEGRGTRFKVESLRFKV